MYQLACGDFESLLSNGNFIPIVAITMGCGVGIVAIVGGMLTSILKTRAREQTKRELAAYVAEGTIDADKAIAMLQAGLPKWEVPKMDCFT